MENTYLSDSSNQAKKIDEEYINKSVKINKEEHDELFSIWKKLKDYEPPKDDMPLPLFVFGLSKTFDKYLTKKARKIVNKQSISNTVHEFYSYPFGFISKILGKFRFRIDPIFWNLIKNLLPVRKAVLVMFIANEVPLSISGEGNYYLEEKYVEKLAKLYNFLADKGMVDHGLLAKPMFMELVPAKDGRKRAALLLYCFPKSHTKGIEGTWQTFNKFLGFDAFVQEGSLSNWNWDLIDQATKNTDKFKGF